MTSVTLKRCVAALLLLAAGHGFGQEQKPLPELPSMGSDPAQAPATQIKPVGAPADKPSADKRVAGFAEMQQARDAFAEFIRAYETGNVVLIQRRLDPAMIGYQQFLDGVRSDTAALRQIRMQLIDTQITAGPDVAVIQTAWEKRSLSAASFQPQLNSGRSQILMHRGTDGWRLVAITGDNLFASATGTTAQLLNTPTFKNGPIGLTEVRAIAIQITDPDLSSRPSIAVQVRSAEGDVETITLPAVGGGVFRVLTLTVRRNAAPGTFVSGNGIVEFGSAPTTLVITYVDTLPVTTVTGVITVVP